MNLVSSGASTSLAHNSLMKKTIALLFPLLLAHCAGSNSDWLDRVYQRASSLKQADSLNDIEKPALISASLEASWGKPKIEISPKGDYRLIYADPTKPFNRLLIYRYHKPLSPLTSPPDASGEKMIKGELTGVDIPQKWRHGKVLNQPVRWFQESLSSGTDGAYFSTEGFSLKDSNGETSHYRIVIEGSEKDMTKRLISLSWKK